MQQRAIGSLQVSAVGLGCMNMSMGYGPADDAVSVKLLSEALDIGYTFFDTAQVYGSGHNEDLIGEAIGNRRSEFILASKCGLTRDGINGDPKGIIASCEASLKRPVSYTHLTLPTILRV